MRENLSSNGKNKELHNGLAISLDGLDELLITISKTLGDKKWRVELEKKIANEIKLNKLEEEIRFSQNKLHSITSQFNLASEEFIKRQSETYSKDIIKIMQEMSTKARNDKSYEKAIEILEEAGNKLLPVIKISSQDKKKLKSSLLEDLEQTLIDFGKLEDALKVFENFEIDDQNEDFIKSQLKKSQLLLKRGKVNASIDLLKYTLEKLEQNDFPDLKHLSEVKRSLGMAYRTSGAYDTALKWFSEAEKDYLKNNDNFGYYNSVWGRGILYHLRGEFDKALLIWNELLDFLKTGIGNNMIGVTPKLLFKLYSEYYHTFIQIGKYNKAKSMINRAMELAENDKYLQLHALLMLTDLQLLQNQIEEASEGLIQIKNLQKQVKENSFTFKILKLEIKILLSQSKGEKAKMLLYSYKNKRMSNWERAHYYRLLGTIERASFNFGLAKNNMTKTLEISKNIGDYNLCLLDELDLIQLLIDMAKAGNKDSFKEAEERLTQLLKEVTANNLPPYILECKLLQGLLSCVIPDYDTAYELFIDIYTNSEENRLLRQKQKAIEALNYVENKIRGKLSEPTIERTVYRYLEDARRILQEDS